MSIPASEPAPAGGVKQIICIKWGTRYTPEHVNRLHAMIARFTHPPFQLFCFTDDPDGIRPHIACRPLPELGCAVPTSGPGKWRKLALWGETLFDVRGTVLFIDLDSVITGPLDAFFELGRPEDVYLARNWVKPLRRLGQTSVFRFTVGAHAYLLERFRSDPERHARECRYEQHFVTRTVRGGVRFWPNRWVRHFRLHCLGPWPMRYVRRPKLPRGALIVTFPGASDPREARFGTRDESNAPLSPWAYLRRTLRAPVSWREKHRQLQRYMMPASWVDEYWRE